MSISWGKVIGGVAVVAGAVVAGIGLGGPTVAGWIGENAVGDAVKGAATSIGEYGGKAATAIAGEEAAKNISGGTVAAIAGGTLAAGGAALALLSGGSKKDDDRLARVEAELEAVKQVLVQMIQGAQQASETQMASVPHKPGGPERS
jgi:hypothetical protein